MGAKIITVFNEKGGAGKTTLTMQLSSALAELGAKVLVADTDTQGAASQWAASALDEKPFPATVIGLAHAGNKLHRELQHHFELFDFILVDCKPSVDSKATQSALVVSDLALIPFIPSPVDAWALTAAKNLVDNAQAVNENLQVRLVVNAYTRTNLSAEVSTLIAETQGLDVLKTELSARSAYRESAAFGGSVLTSSRDAKAQQEVRALAAEVLTLFEEV